MKRKSVAKSRYISSLLRLTRAGNLFIIAFSQYFTATFLLNKTTLDDVRLLIMVISTVIIAAAGYIINDYYDVKIDYINKPDRVVIGKTITRRYAILFHVLLSLMGIALGVVLNWRIGVVNAFSVFLLWFYSNYLKRLPFVGNFAVAALTGLAILVIDMLYAAGNPLIYIYASFAFFMTLIREIIKDMEDLKGDNSFGCKTLPIVIGLRKTKSIIYIILGVFAVIVVVLNYFFKALPFSYYVLFLLGPLVYLLFRLAAADTKKDFARLSSFCKVIMLLGIFSMVFV